MEKHVLCTDELRVRFSPAPFKFMNLNCEYHGGKPPTFQDLGYASEEEFFEDYNSMLDDMAHVGINGYTNEHLALGPSYKEYVGARVAHPNGLQNRKVEGSNPSLRATITKYDY
jgi:hypothetical protein